jgi:hypothetical protein
LQLPGALRRKTAQGRLEQRHLSDHGAGDDRCREDVDEPEDVCQNVDLATSADSSGVLVTKIVNCCGP